MPDSAPHQPSEQDMSTLISETHAKGNAQLDITRLTIRLTDTPKTLPDPETLKFGRTFTDHMAVASFDPVSGWSPPEIKPYAPIVLDPASSCFHHCGNVFEGMKAYLGRDGKVRLFRPEMNMRRLGGSMARLALPSVDVDAVLQLIKRFVQIEKRWIPALPGYSLYLRPTVIGTRAELNVVASDYAILYVIASPCPPPSPHPISLLAMPNVVRAWPGGTGGHKFGGNYSPGFLPQREAREQGYGKVLWLFGPNRNVTEAGAMNICAVVDRADGHGWDVITPPLDGTILPGVTRASCLTLSADPAFHTAVFAGSSVNDGGNLNGIDSAGRRVRLHPAERAFTMDDLARWAADGALREVFCIGTATLVLAVERIGFEGRDVFPPGYPADENGLGPVGRALRAKISGVQAGTEDYDGWGVVVCEAKSAAFF